MGKQEEFRKRLLATFGVEAEEHLQAISSGLLELEKMPAAERQMEIIEAVFREAHSLKGAARSVNMVEVERICQSLESVFAALKRKEIALSPALSDMLYQAAEGLRRSLSSPEVERSSCETIRMRELGQRLEDASKGMLSAPKQEEAEHPVALEKEAAQPPEKVTELRPLTQERPATAKTVRIPTARLDILMRQTEELIPEKLAAGQRVLELQEANAFLAAWKKEWARVRPDVRAIQQFLDRNGRTHPQDGRKNLASLMEFIDWTNGYIRSLEVRLSALSASAEGGTRSLSGRVDALLEDMKRVLMLPFSSLLEAFPGFVRELSRSQGKQVEMVTQGGDLEIDRRVLEEMRDPLLHLVRNCLDHGIEKPEERERKGKPPRGTVRIAIAPKNGDKAEVIVADDGAGIDAASVRAAALKLGTVPPEAAGKLDEKEALSLIFQSGVSTSPIITDISGRGLGLAIVREKAEKLGGVVSVEVNPDAGTTFRMVLPLTLVTFRGVLVRVEEHLLVLPAISVERALRVDRENIQTVENRETLSLDGQVLSLVRLGDALEIPRKKAADDDTGSVHGVVLGSGEKRIAFLVDEVLHEQEVLVKTLGKQLSRVRNIAGATVLGTGKVVPILNVPDLMKSAVRVSAAAARPAAAPVEQEETRRKSVLVAEDSITARTLLKNILEAAGYEVKTAIDGVDAFTLLRSGEFDLVVSDVDMPRMSGFDLTAKVRSDKKHAELPVVLVTALESREDRERGIDVGANAYIVKSSFDRSNLLEVIQRLI